MTFEKACRSLLMTEPFYGLFLTTLDKIITDEVPTLAVGLRGINQVLYVNPEFWSSLTDKEQLAVLKHELIHICFFHLSMGKDMSNKKVANIAMDAEVNQYIENLPDGCVTISSLNRQFGHLGLSLKGNEGSVSYYKKLIDMIDNNHEEFSGDGATISQGEASGSHDKWKELDGMSDSERKLVENQIKHNVKNVAEHIRKNKGSTPSELRGVIDELFKVKEPVFNWKAYFRRLVGNSSFVYTKKTLRKQSKRFEDNAGIKIKQKTNILVGIDTSGSLSDDELKDFFSEIQHIYKAGAKVTIVECDAAIGRVYEYKGKFDGKVTGGGGTNLAPVIEYYNKNRKDFTTLVFFTDGYASLTNFKVMKKMIWVISSNGDHNQKYPGGVKISIPKISND